MQVRYLGCSLAKLICTEMKVQFKEVKDLSDKARALIAAAAFQMKKFG